MADPVKRVVSRRLRRSDVRRAAPALPNGFTLGNLFFGIFAIVSASRGEFAQAVLFIVLGGVCDGFDGRIARATGTGSRFGVELDSLVDAISFGFAPAMIIYFSVLDREGGAWWLLVVPVHGLRGRPPRALQRDAGRRSQTSFPGTSEPRGRRTPWRRTTGSARRRSTTRHASPTCPGPTWSRC